MCEKDIYVTNGIPYGIPWRTSLRLALGVSPRLLHGPHWLALLLFSLFLVCSTHINTHGTHTPTHTHTHAYTHTHTYPHTHVNLGTHTHTHTHLPSRTESIPELVNSSATDEDSDSSDNVRSNVGPKISGVPVNILRVPNLSVRTDAIDDSSSGRDSSSTSDDEPTIDMEPEDTEPTSSVSLGYHRTEVVLVDALYAAEILTMKWYKVHNCVCIT